MRARYILILLMLAAAASADVMTERTVYDIKDVVVITANSSNGTVTVEDPNSYSRGLGQCVGNCTFNFTGRLLAMGYYQAHLWENDTITGNATFVIQNGVNSSNLANISLDDNYLLGENITARIEISKDSHVRIRAKDQIFRGPDLLLSKGKTFEYNVLAFSDIIGSNRMEVITDGRITATAGFTVTETSIPTFTERIEEIEAISLTTDKRRYLPGEIVRIITSPSQAKAEITVRKNDIFYNITNKTFSSNVTGRYFVEALITSGETRTRVSHGFVIEEEKPKIEISVENDTARIDAEGMIEIKSPSGAIIRMNSSNATFTSTERGLHRARIIGTDVFKEFRIGKREILLSTNIEDSSKRRLKANLEIRGARRIEARNDELVALEEGIYDVAVEPAPEENLSVERIEFSNVTINDSFRLRLERLDREEFVESYAIDPTELNFTNATVRARARGTKLYKCSLWNFSGQICEGEWTLFRQDLTPGEIYTFTITPGDPAFGETLEIIDVQSYPTVMGNWTVEFSTQGTHDLTIRAADGTTWSDSTQDEDLKLLEIRCGADRVEYEWKNNTAFIEDYNCEHTSFETSKVLTMGKHTLEFSFGGETEYAYNDASPYATVGEWGRETDLTSSWTEVNFGHVFEDVPVVVTSAEYDYSYDDNPCYTRIRNVSKTGFEIRSERWSSTSCPSTGFHAYWLAMEKGVYNISNDGVPAREVEVRNFTMSASACGSGANPTDWTLSANHRNFQNSWTYMPLVLGGVQTANDDDVIAHYITSCTTNEAAEYDSSCVQIGLNGMENDGTTQPCTLHTQDEEGGYIAWEMDSDWTDAESRDNTGNTSNSLRSYSWEAYWESDNVAGTQNDGAPLDSYYVTLSQTFDEGAPFTSGIRIDGANGLYPAMDFDPPADRVYFVAEEDEYGDTEQTHTAEPWQVLFFNETSGFLYSDELRYPFIDVISPQNTTYGSSSVDYNISLEIAIDTCLSSLDSAMNTTMNKLNSTYFYHTEISLSQGSHEVEFSCNTTAGAWNSTISSFIVDTIPPGWQNVSTTNTSPEVGDFVNLSAEWSDNLGLDNWTLEWNATLTGAYENVSSGSFTGTSNVSSSYIELPGASAGKTVGFRFYAFDHGDSLNATNISTMDVQQPPDSTPPEINSYSISPGSDGYGQNFTIKANVTDDVAVLVVYANVTHPDGYSQLVQLDPWSGDIYRGIFSDGWDDGSYQAYILANDSAGNYNDSSSSPMMFDISVNISSVVNLEYDIYSTNEDVYMLEYNWTLYDWDYRNEVQITGILSDLTDYQVNITMDTATLISEGKMADGCTDVRAMHEEMQLEIWVQDCDSSETTIWTKMNLTSGQEETIYVYYGNDNAQNTSNSSATMDRMEAGRIEGTDQWQTVSYQQGYSDPIVIAGYEEGSSGATEASPRITNVTTQNFTIRMQNPVNETVPAVNITYIVIDRGTFKMLDGTLIEADSKTETNVVGDGTADTWGSISFSNTYVSPPVVLAQVMSNNDGLWVTEHVDSITSTDASIAMEMGQLCNTAICSGHDPETLGWVAVQTGRTGLFESNPYETDGTTNSYTGHDDACNTHSFSQTFSKAPEVMIADQITRNGGDGGWTTICSLTSTEAGMHSEEEDYSDSERGHTTETNNFLAIENTGEILLRKMTGAEPTISVIGEERRPSSFNNIGSTNSSGYVMVQVLSNFSGDVLSTPVNESSSEGARQISEGDDLLTGEAYNPYVWNTLTRSTGYYIIRAYLTGPDGEILQNENGSDISAEHVFYIDHEAPEWDEVWTNNSNPAPQDYVSFYSNWTDNGELKAWVFFWNANGSMKKAGEGEFTSTPGTANRTILIPDTADGQVVSYYFEANDTKGLSDTTDIFNITVQDSSSPVVSSGSVSPDLDNRYEPVDITADVTDNNGVNSTWLEIGKPDGSFENRSMSHLSGSTYNLTYSPDQIGEYNYTVHANDSAGNTDNGSTFFSTAYGWSSSAFVSPVSAQKVQTLVNVTCSVQDTNTSSAIGSYPVSFWNNGTYLGTNHTNQSGEADIVWNTTGLDGGEHILNCTIEDNLTLLYNASLKNSWQLIDILVPNVTLANLEAENQEYESGDTIDWINVTVNNTGDAQAYSTNITLRLLKGSTHAAWFESQVYDCQDINDSCTGNFSSDIIVDSAQGTYSWNVTTDWSGGGTPPREYAVQPFTIHRILDNISSDIEPTKIIRTQNSSYNLTLTNPWSSALTDVNASINCFSGANCTCSGQEEGYCSQASIGSLSSATFEFLIQTDNDTTADDYTINANITYTNPGPETRTWLEVGNGTLQVRKETTLRTYITDVTSYTTNWTRGTLNDLTGYVNNTGPVDAEDLWLNYTLAPGWVNTSGSINMTITSLSPSHIRWNNITINLTSSTSLGANEIELRSESSNQSADWDTKFINVYSRTSIIDVTADKSKASRNETIRIEGRLIYDNQSGVEGQTLRARIGGEVIGTNVTNSTGEFMIKSRVPWNSTLGANEINISYPGNASSFTHGSTNTSLSVDVDDQIGFSNLQATRYTGYGQDVEIAIDISSLVSKDSVVANITYPNNDKTVLPMSYVSGDRFSVNFTDTWQWGTYDLAITANNTAGFENTSNVTSFYVRANVTTNVQTQRDIYYPDENVFVTGETWWNNSWPYRIGVDIGYSGTVEEYQIGIVTNLTDAFSAGKIDQGCADVRFTWLNTTEQQVDFWTEECDTSGGLSTFWVKLPEISGTEKVYLYYGNPDAEEASNITDTFSYSSPRIVGYVVSDRMASTGASLMSLCDENTVQVDSSQYLLNETETATPSISQNSSVSATCGLHMDGSGSYTDTITPISWAGTEFIYGGMRDTSDVFCMLAPFADAEVNISDGGGANQNENVTAEGTCVTKDITDGNALRITSTVPILVSYYGSAGSDAYPMRPATTDVLYGVPSQTFVAATGGDGATIYYARSDSSSTTSQSISADSEYSQGGLGTSGKGDAPAYMVYGTNPIGAIQQADSDGTEATTFVTGGGLATKFGSLRDAQYIAIATPFADANCTTYSGGTPVETRNASGQNGIYKICFDCGNTNLYLSGSWTMECTRPVAAYYEEHSGNAETQLLGQTQMRRYIWPEPQVDAGTEKQNTKAQNEGDTNTSAYVRMHIYRSDQLISTQVNEGTPIQIETLDIGALWNPWNTTDSENGTYEVLVELTDINGDQLRSDNGTLMNATYSFDLLSVKVNVTVDQSAGITTDLTIYNSSGYPVASSSQNFTASIRPSQLYDIRIESETSEGLQVTTLKDVSIQDDITFETQVIDDYAGYLPENISSVTPIYAMVDPTAAYDHAELEIPKAGLEMEYIFHCTAWDYGKANCTSWEVNESSEYDFYENSTHMFINVTSFDAFGGGPGNTLPNLTSIMIYNVTGVADDRNGGSLVGQGLGSVFNITMGDRFRVEFNVTNRGRKWDIGSEDVAYHAGLNETWNVDIADIWYSADGGATNITGGTFSGGQVSWSLSSGTLDPDESGIWSYIFTADTTKREEYSVSFLINDTSTSSGSTDSSVYNITYDQELLINRSKMSTSAEEAAEDDIVQINATIENLGINDANNLDIEIEDNLTGNTIYQRTINVSAESSYLLVYNWTAEIGSHTLIFKADTPLASGGNIDEHNESDNKANVTINVSNWHTFYGDIQGNMTLATSSGPIMNWEVSDLIGNIYIADSDSEIDWGSLKAMGRDSANASSFEDFHEADLAINLSQFKDSINATFTENDAIRASRGYEVFDSNITDVPIVNSTNTSSFRTGMLWDMSDSGDGSFDDTDAEDIVFITEINEDTEGKNGVHDYEIRVPRRLATYKGTTDSLEVYAEIR